ncbi:unnamed protein product [Closterium sp. NIES-54]
MHMIASHNTMHALSDSAESDCYLSVPPNPGIADAALGASASAAPSTGESAAPGTGESALSGTAPTEAFHTFTLDSSASRSFFRDSTTLMPLSRPVAVSLADLSGGPVLAHSFMVLPCPAALSGLLSGLHLPSSSTNLVSGADLQDAGVDQFAPGGQRVTHCTCSRTGRHLATFTRRPGSSQYTLTTAPPPVSASGPVAVSSQVFAAASRSSPASAPYSCRPLSHETLLWHHHLGHPSLPRLRGMASRTLVSGLPRSFPPLPPGPAPTIFTCVEGRQRASPHSCTFPPTEAPLQTLHMDVWGPARVPGQGHERYFLLVVDDYTTVFPLCSKGEVPEVLIDWIRGTRCQLSESFGSDLLVLRLHSDRGGEFSSDLLRAFCRTEGIRQTFTLPASPKQNGIAERRIAMVMDVAPDKLSSRAVPCVFLGFPPDAPGWQFYHPTSRRVLSSQDVTSDESVSYYRLFPYHTASLPPPAALPSTRRAEPGGAAPGRVEPEGTSSGGTEPARAESGGALGVPSWREPLSPQQLREWYSRRCGGATGDGAAGGAAGAAGGAAGAGAFGAPGGAAGAAGGAAGDGATGAAGGAAGATGGVAAAGAASGAAGAASGAAGAAGGAAGTGDPKAEGPGSVSAVSVGAARPWSSYTPLFQQPTSPLPGPSPYSGPTRGLSERCEPESRPVSPEFRSVSPVRTVRAGLVLRQRPPPVPGTHSMNLRPSTIPQRVPLLSTPMSSLPTGPDPASDSLRAFSPAVTRFLAIAVTDPLFESTAASALVTELVDFDAACPLDYATSLVAESTSASVCPPSVGGECALGTDVLEDRQEEFEGFAATVPHLWQAAMDAEMASWKSTGTYVDEVPPPRANIRDYELHSLDFSTTFLQGILHEEIWLRRPPGFTGSFPAGTQWSLRRPSTVSAKRPVLQRFGFTYSSPQSIPLLSGHSLSAPPSDESVEPSGPYPELVGCLMYLMTCTRPDLAYPLSLMARYVAPGRHRKVHWDAAKRVLRYLCSTLGMGLVLGGRARVVLTGHADASWDVTFDESVPFYHLFPYCSARPPPLPLFFTPNPLPGTAPVEVAVGSGAAHGTASWGAASGGAEPGGAESEGAGSGGAEPKGAEREGHCFLWSGAAGAGDSTIGDTGVGGAGEAGTGGFGGAGARDPMEPGAARAGGAGAVGAGAGGTGAGGAGVGGAKAVDPRAGGAGGTVRPRLYFFPLLQKPVSPLPAPSPYTEQAGGLTERREPAPHPSSPVRTGRRVPRSPPPLVRGTHARALRPSSVPLHVPLPPPSESSLPANPDPESDRARAASPIILRLLSTVVTSRE